MLGFIKAGIHFKIGVFIMKERIKGSMTFRRGEHIRNDEKVRKEDKRGNDIKGNKNWHVSASQT